MEKQRDLSAAWQKIASQSRQKVHYVARLLTFVVQRYFDDKLGYVAAALTFTTLLSIVPLMSVSFALLKAFPAFEQMSKEITNFIFTNFVPTSGDQIRTYLDDFILHSSQLTLIGSIFLFVTAIMTMWTIEQAFNEIWRVQRARSGVSAFMLYWAVLTITPFLFGMSLFVSSYLLSLPVINTTATSLGLANNLLFLSAFILEIAGLILLYMAVPNTRVRFRDAAIGGICAAILLEGSKKCFALYVTSFPTYQLIYGTLATIPIVLIWIYILWLIILIGAELSNALAYDHSDAASRSTDQFVVAFLWLSHLFAAQKEGRAVSLRELLHHYGGDGCIEPERIMDALLRYQWVSQLSNGDYVLMRDCHQMTLHAFYVELPWRLPSANQLKKHRLPQESRLFHALQETDTQIHAALSLTLAECFQQDTVNASSGTG